MSIELCDDSKPTVTRQLAGVILKNCLDAQDDRLAAERAQKWTALPDQIKNGVKQRLFTGLASKLRQARHTCAQVVAKVARIEVPQKQWPKLVVALQHNVQTRTNAPELVQSSLETIGYVCEEVDPSALQKTDLNRILTAICDGMSRSKTPDVALAGCQAMFNALDFVKANFDNAKESQIIMTQICNNTQHPDARLRQKAFECTWRVADLYYEKLQPFMQHLFKITLKAVSSDPVQEVSLQALEFWLTVCDREADLIAEAEHNANVKCAQYVLHALKQLLNLTFASLTKQEEHADDDDWNIAKAGGVLLVQICTVVNVACVPAVMNFVQSKIGSQNWRDREAAMLAFGSILTHETSASLANNAVKILPILLNTLSKDPHVNVRDTTAWTLGQVCGFYGTKFPKNVMESIVKIGVHCLAAEPKVANNACFVFHNLAQAVETADQADVSSNILSPYFQHMVQALLNCADRKDADEANLMTAAYEAIGLIMQCAAQDSLALVKKLIPHLCQKLSQSVNRGSNQVADVLQSLLCGALQTCIAKLGEDVASFADMLMSQLLRVFTLKNATAHEESFMAIGAIANAIESKFSKYITHLHPFLKRALMDHQNTQVCVCATGVVGDVARAMETQLPIQFCDEIMTILLQNLSQPTLDRRCKAPILAVFGDFALAIETKYAKYLQPTMNRLQQASMTSIPDEDDEDIVDFVLTLRDNILDAYAGIAQGMKNDGAKLMPFVPSMASFCRNMTNNKFRGDDQTRNIAGVVGDLVQAVGKVNMSTVLQDPFVRLILKDCMQSSSESTRQVGSFLRDVAS